MKINSINYQANGFKANTKTNVNFKSTKISPVLLNKVKNISQNQNTRDIFIKLASIVGLTSIIGWINSLKNNENQEEINNKLDIIDTNWTDKNAKLYLNPETQAEYLDLVSQADSTESILWTKGLLSDTEKQTEIKTQEKNVKELFLDEKSNETYMVVSANKTIASLMTQIKAIESAKEDSKREILNNLEIKLNSLIKQADELQNTEETAELYVKISNIAKMFTLLNLSEKQPNKIQTIKTGNNTLEPTETEAEKSIIEEHKEEEEVNENITVESEPEVTAEDSAVSNADTATNPVNAVEKEVKLSGPKIIGKVDLSQFESSKKNKTEVHTAPPIELKELIVTPKNKKLIEAYRQIFENINGTYPPEIYGDKIELIKSIYDSYGEKENVKGLLLCSLVKEDLNKLLEKYEKMPSGIKAKIDFINYMKLKLKASEKGTLSDDDLITIADWKDTIMKYYQANTEEKKLIVSFRKEVSVEDRLKYTIDFYKRAFNIVGEIPSEKFNEPIEILDVKKEITKRLLENPQDYPNILDYLGINDLSEIDIQIEKGNLDEAFELLEEYYTTPNIEANLKRLTALLNNESFSNFFASTHSRMRLIERFVLNKQDENLLYKSATDTVKQKEAFDKKLEKNISRAVLDIKKTIQNAKEIEIYNYVLNKGSKKAENISRPNIVIKDTNLALNDNGEICTIFTID